MTAVNSHSTVVIIASTALTSEKIQSTREIGLQEGLRFVYEGKITLCDFSLKPYKLHLFFLTSDKNVFSFAIEMFLS